MGICYCCDSRVFLGKLFYLKMLIAQKFWQIFCLLKLHQIWWLLNENICYYLCDRSILRRTDGRGGRTEETAISILPPPQLTTILLFWETVIVRHCPHLTNCAHTSSASHWWAGTCVTTQDSPVYIQSSICIVRFTFLPPASALFSAHALPPAFLWLRSASIIGGLAGGWTRGAGSFRLSGSKLTTNWHLAPTCPTQNLCGHFRDTAKSMLFGGARMLRGSRWNGKKSHFSNLAAAAVSQQWTSAAALSQRSQAPFIQFESVNLTLWTRNCAFSSPAVLHTLSSTSSNTVKPRLSALGLKALGFKHIIFISIGWALVISFLANSALKTTSLEGKKLCGSFKNAQPGFNCTNGIAFLC